MSDKLSGISAVIADDNDTTRAMLRGILRQEGIEVIGEAKDGPSAVAMVRKFAPKVLCLDVNMPNGSGLDALKQIKADHPATRVLMVTGSTDRDTVQAAIAGGASGYVVKPFNAAKVLAAVTQALGIPPEG
jgi:two-component system, chemotaxis family, chemotaxis protein CheY